MPRPLYPLLTRHEGEGLLEATWRAGEGGPGRKYFELTGAGRAELTRRDVLWAEFVTRTRRPLPADPDVDDVPALNSLEM